MPGTPNMFNRKHSFRKLIAVLFAFSAILTAMDLVWVSHRRTITVSTGTTRIMGPLAANGTVNYRQAIDRHAALGVTPTNNAAVDLVRALGPAAVGRGIVGLNAMNRIGMKMLPAKGDYYVTYKQCYSWAHPSDVHGDKIARPRGTLGRHPFSAADHPVTAAWLKANAVPLHFARLAAEQSRFFIPLPRRSLGWYALPNAPMPYLAKVDEIQEALLQQGMLALHGGDDALCTRDLLAAHRLAGLVGQGPLLSQAIVARNMDLRASQADWTFLRSKQITAATADAYATAIALLPSLRPLSKDVDHFSRWAELDYVQWQAEDWWGRSVGVHQAGFPIRVSALLPPNYTVRMMRINRWYDRFTKVFQAKGAGARRKELAIVELQLNTPSGGTRMSRQRLYLSLMGENYNSLIALSARVKSARRITRTLLALRRFRMDHGAYPRSLGDLVPNYLPQLPLDAFTGKPILLVRARGTYSLVMAASFDSLSPAGQVPLADGQMVVNLSLH